MNTPTFDFGELTKRIEHVVQQHLAEYRRAAQGAVDRAFAAALYPVPPAGAGSPKATGTVCRERKPAQRRNQVELAALGKRLHETVCAHPGETMAALARMVEVSSQDLQRPMAWLLQSGKIRHVGERCHRRYYPLEEASA
jgi:hypothetical protein